MAIVTLADYLAFSGQSGTEDAARDAALTQVLAQLDAAVKRLCYPYQFEPGTDTDAILDAPANSPWLCLPLVPVRAVTSVYQREPTWQSDVSQFTEEDLLEANVDYRLRVDMRPEGWSRSGIIERLDRISWGWSYRRPPARLANELGPARNAVKVTYDYGHLTPPPDVAQAVCLAASKVMLARRLGAQSTSASLNGASYSLPGPATQAGVWGDPHIQSLLAPYVNLRLSSR